MQHAPLSRVLIYLTAMLIIFSGVSETRRSGLAASNASFSLGKTVITEGEDFATLELGQPWDMNGSPYPDFFTTLKNINPQDFKVNGSGFWELESTSSDPRIWLHWTGVGTTQNVLRLGDTRPIDTEKYHLLSYYMCLDQAPSPQPGVDNDWAAIVYWMYDRTPHEDPANGYTDFVLFKQQGRFKTPGTCELMTFDLGQSSGWAKGSWNNNPVKPMGLRLDPINKSNKDFQVGWVRLTSVDPANSVPLNWSGAPPGTVKFYLSLAGCGQDGILVGTHPNPNGSGSFQWGQTLQAGYAIDHPLPIPESFEPGQYDVYMEDVNGGVACSGAQLTVHPAPILEFQRPSFYSGPDYAATVVKDPWGMANANDLSSYGGISGLTFSDGILSARTVNTDARLFLNLQNAINANKYRYATFRMRIEGENANGDGWVQRYVWWYQGPGIDAITTQDMEIYSGWHTYTIDLETAGLENCSGNCWSGFPTTLRFDPFETANTNFFIDFVTLTGTDTITRGSQANIHYTLPNAPNANVTFYYDNDRNPNNGRTPLVQSSTPALITGSDAFLPFSIYLPLLLQPGEIDFFRFSLKYVWDTSPVPTNTYYISADVNDGVMTTTWYSEAPVIIE